MTKRTTGLDPDRIPGTNFIMLHLDLVDDLDGDFLAALLLDRIRFRAGDGWWIATRKQLLADTRMNEYQFKRSMNVLKAAGYVETQRVSTYDATLKYRVVMAETVETVEVANIANTGLRISPPDVANAAVSEVANIAVSSTKNSEEPSKNKTLVSAEPPRADVQALCDLLANQIQDNGAPRPNITKGWLDAARLMLDRDGIEYTHIEGAIKWATGHEFWRANILSMPKLREKYQQLRLQAEREHRSRAESSTTDQRVTAAAKLAYELRAEESQSQQKAIR